MACNTCQSYFGDWRSHGPTFPDWAWEILEKEEFPVGTHGGSTGMAGTAKCKSCGQLATFDCSYGPGYSFNEKK